MRTTLTGHLVESVHSTFKNAFTISVHEIPSPQEEALIYAQIEISNDTETQKVIIGMPKEGIVFLGGIYFGYANDFSNEELEDFIKELSNLILGRVKVAYLSSDKEAKLKIPKIIELKDIDTTIVRYFQIKDTYIMIAY